MTSPPSITDLAARYDSVRRRRNTISLASEEWEALEAEGDQWGVGAFCHHDGAVLLVHEGERWLLPGGTLEPDETPEEGAIREVREETGVAIEIRGLAAISEQTFVDEADSTKRFEFRFATFLGTVADPATAADPTTATDPGLDGEGIEEAGWLGEIPENTFERDLVVSLFDSAIG